jgi:cytochrome c oxidase cbb3-type subunit 2
MSATSPIQLGSARTGVDLSQEGGEHPDDWHIAHFINPRYTRPNSIMPPFRWLGEERIDTLTRYVQSLGHEGADQRMARQRFWKAEAIKAYEAGPGCQRPVAGRHRAPGLARSAQSLPPTAGASLQRGACDLPAVSASAATDRWATAWDRPSRGSIRRR